MQPLRPRLACQSRIGVDECSREIYREWGACQHFELYDDVSLVLQQLADAGYRIGLITKADLITRDIPLFQEIGRRHYLSLVLTITTLDRDPLRSKRPETGRDSVVRSGVFGEPLDDAAAAGHRLEALAGEGHGGAVPGDRRGLSESIDDTREAVFPLLGAT